MATSFPTTGIIDAFDRADGQPSFTGGGWTNQIEGANSGTLSILTNQLAVLTNGTGESSSAWYNTSTYGADCEVYCTVSTLPGAGNPTELYARLASPGSAAVDGYSVMFWHSDSVLRVYRYDNGATTQLGADISRTSVAGDSFGMQIIGSTIEVWYKASGGVWSSYGTRTDSTYSAEGNLGVGMWFSTVRVDDFGGGTYVPPTANVSWMNA